MGPNSSTVGLTSLLTGDLIHCNYCNKKTPKTGSRLQLSRGDSVCSFTGCRRDAKGFCGRRMCACIRLSLALCRAIPFFRHHSECNTTSLFSSLSGALSFFPTPILLPFRNNLSIIVPSSATVFYSQSNNLAVSLACTLLPRLEAALSVAPCLNSARLNASTWLYAHTHPL